MAPGVEWVSSPLLTLVPVPAVKLPLLAETLRPAAVRLELVVLTVKVIWTVSPGATSVAEAENDAVVVVSAELPWQEVQPVVERPVRPELLAWAGGAARRASASKVDMAGM
jgi:hypothetical protein